MTFRIQPHVRLQEWVAEEHGYFREAGLDYEFVPSLAGASVTTSSVRTANEAPAEFTSGAFEDMQQGRSCDVSAACHWAVNAAATAGGGKMWGRAYSVCPSAIFVTPESGCQRPEDLAGVPVGVGYHSGSHYSAIQGLAPYLERPQITLNFAGLPYDRVRLMLERKLAAANVFGAQYYVLEQQGFRKLVDTTFMMGFLVSEDTVPDQAEKYFQALRRAQRDIDLDPGRWTCAGSAPASGSSGSPTPARCSTRPTAGCRPGNYSTPGPPPARITGRPSCPESGHPPLGPDPATRCRSPRPAPGRIPRACPR
jgi:NitT/TauT family transport system substrate-binding protein